jgi:NADH:ubiquinone oxidoreductase subunit E
MMINESVYGSLTPEKAREIVRKIKAEGEGK